MISTNYHLSCSKSFLLMSIERYGAKILVHFQGTKNDAIEYVQKWPHDSCVIGPCDNQDQGECLGHKLGKEGE